MSRRNGLILVPILVCLAEKGCLAGSCGSAKLCCQGRDSGCVIQKESPNAIIASPRDKPCYCDHACLKLADCCDDFKETCGVVDCAVSEWSLWTPCDNRCGTGTQRRSRMVEVPERNGGKHCPRLDQVRSCRSFQNCPPGPIRPQSHAKSLSIVALFPPERNGTDQPLDQDQTASCVPFTIVRASRACTKASAALTEGTRICVERPMNEIANDLVGIVRWRLAWTVGRNATTCHGKWIGDSRLSLGCQDDRCRDSTRAILTVDSGRDRRSILMSAAVRDRRTRARQAAVWRRRGRRRNHHRRNRRRSLANQESRV